MNFNLKNTLIALSITAVVLGIITYIVVFSSSGDYVVTNIPGITGSSSSGTSPLGPGATSTTSTTSSTSSTSGTSTGAFLPLSLSNALAADGNASGTAETSPQSFSTEYQTPPLTWQEGQATLAITGAVFANHSLTLAVRVAMGNSTECVPVHLNILADESGTLISPQTTQFSFPESGDCHGAPGAIYDGEQIIFSVSPAQFPLTITTGGASNVYFQVATTTSGGIAIGVPSRQG